MSLIHHCLWLCWLCLCVVLSACGSDQSNHLPAQSKVLILGDSLTQGVGASDQSHTYPHLLEQHSRWQVINGGISGNTSEQALQRLPELLKTHQPQLVIISIGGNDFLQRKPTNQTMINISQSITLSQQSGAEVLLVAVPYLSLAAAVGHPKDHKMYQQLAQQHQVPLLEDAWSDVLGDKSLRSDAVHANDQGYAEFHEQLVKKLEQIGWLK